MATRRSRLELIFDILLAIQNKGGTIKPTHLMYKSNLSHKLLNNYIEELISGIRMGLAFEYSDYIFYLAIQNMGAAGYANSISFN